MKRILIVDDVVHIAKIIDKILTKEGYETDICHDGQQAIDKLKESKFDIIVSDIIMPNKDGFNILNYLEDKKLDIKIVMMTGGGVKISAVETMRAVKDQANIVLLKPISKEDLLTAIESVVA